MANHNGSPKAGATISCDPDRLQELAKSKGYLNCHALFKATELARATVTNAWNGKPLILRSIQEIARVLDCEYADLLSPADMMKLSVPCITGINEIYAGEQHNEIRNAAKQSAIRRTRGRGNVLLLARTGYSYLSALGPHNLVVCNHLRDEDYDDNSFAAVILNPYSMAAIEVYLTWIHSCGGGGRVADYLAKQLEKLAHSLLGFKALRDKFNDRIQLFLTSFDISMTILATHDAIFVEPYFQADEEKRNAQGLIGFEIEAECGGHLGRLLGPSPRGSKEYLSHLDFFLTHSIPYDDWRTHRPTLESHFRSALKVLVKTGEVQKGDASAMEVALKSLCL